MVVPNRLVARWRCWSPQTRRLIVAAAILVVAFAARLAYVLGTQQYVPLGDARSYDRLGQGLAEGHGWVIGDSAYRPPGFPFLLAGVYGVIGVPHGSWTAVRVFQAFLGTVTVGLIGLMVRQVAGSTAALIALAIAAIYLPLVLVGDSLMTESLFVPVILAATSCALCSRTAMHPYRWIMAAGALSGLAALTRGNGLFIGFALVFVAGTRGSWRSMRVLSTPVVPLVAMVLVISPWSVRNAIAQHAFIPVTTELGNTLSGTYNDVAARHHFIWVNNGYDNYRSIKKDRRVSEATRNSRLTTAVLKYVIRHPLYVPQVMFWNTMRLMDLQGRFVYRRTARQDLDVSAGMADLAVYTFWVVGLLALAGFFASSTRRVPRSFWAVPLFVWASEAPLTTGTPRFRAALDPFVIMLAAFGVQSIATAVTRRKAPQSVRRTVDGTAIPN